MVEIGVADEDPFEVLRVDELLQLIKELAPESIARRIDQHRFSRVNEMRVGR